MEWRCASGTALMEYALPINWQISHYGAEGTTINQIHIPPLKKLQCHFHKPTENCQFGGRERRREPDVGFSYGEDKLQTAISYHPKQANNTKAIA